jgi:hypothetical protein
MAALQNTVSITKQRTPLAYFLAFIFVLFIAILVVVYLITRQSNPVMLDEHGKPVATRSFVPETSSGAWAA